MHDRNVKFSKEERDRIRLNLSLLNSPASRRQRLIQSIKILLAYGFLGFCIWLLLHFAGWDILGKVGFGYLWLGLMIPMWLFSHKIALALNKAVLADGNNPRHQKGIKASARAFAGTGYNPPVYASPDPRGNAFATGPFPAWAVVAFTEGILDLLTEDELWAVFCHEATHVLDWHVFINSLAGALSMTFSLLVDVVVRGVLFPINLVRRGFGMKPLSADQPQQHGFLSGILMNVVMYAVFYVTSSFTRLVQLFVVRSAESQADAGAAAMTDAPCLLVSALEKLVRAAEQNRPKGRAEMVWLSTRLISIIDPIYDNRAPDPQPQGIWQRVKAFWKYLQLSHPPVPVRRADLESMYGSKCPDLTPA